MAARTTGFLSGPTGVHSTQKIRKHKLKRGITRDMNAAAGTLVNTKNPYSPGSKAVVSIADVTYADAKGNVTLEAETDSIKIVTCFDVNDAGVCDADDEDTSMENNVSID